jgi:hypothetical protein
MKSLFALRDTYGSNQDLLAGDHVLGCPFR